MDSRTSFGDINEEIKDINNRHLPDRQSLYAEHGQI